MQRIGVVIPTIGTEGYIYNLVTELIKQDEYEHMYIYVNLPEGSYIGDRLMQINGRDIYVERVPEANIHHMWNMGVGEAAANGDTHVVILNDDILINSNFLTNLISPFDADPDIWATSANWDAREFEGEYKYFPGTRKDGGLCGFAFAVSMQAFIDGLPDFDETYKWWYGDDDFYHNVALCQKKAVMAKRADIIHIGGGSQSIGDRGRYVNEFTEADTKHYMEKWHNG